MATMRRSLAPISDNRPRASMNGAALRKSMMEAVAPLATPSRSNNRMSMGPTRLSSAFGNAHVSNRMSMGGRPSVGAPLGAAGTQLTERQKDPRNIRDRNYIEMSIRTLIKFLTESGYDRPISPKILNAPSARDFQNIFMFLYHLIDPNYEVTGKFEDEVPVLIRALRYPFASDIGKSQLMAVGSMHAWPTLLAMLVWMVELILSCSMAVEVADQTQEAFLLTYLTTAYAAWMNFDENPNLDAELVSSIEKKNALIEDDIRRLEDNHKEMQAELDRLARDQPPLAEMEKRIGDLNETVDGLNKLIVALSTKKGKLNDTIKSQKDEQSARDADLSAVTRERASLESTLSTQDLSPSDVLRMHSERSSLESTLAATLSTRESAQSHIDSLEMSLAKLHSSLDHALHTYHSKCSLIFTKSGVSFDYSLSLGNAHMMSVMLKGGIKSQLNLIRESLSSKENALLESRASVSEALEAAEEALLEAKKEETSLAKRLNGEEAQLQVQKEAHAKMNVAMAAAAEEMERRLMSVKAGAEKGGVAGEKGEKESASVAEEKVREKEEQVNKYTNETIALLDMMIQHKSHIEATLAELKALAVNEARNAEV